MKQPKNYVSVNSLSPQDKTKVKNVMNSLNDSMTRSAGERLFVKEAISVLSEDTGLDPKLIKKMSKTFYNASFNEENEAHQTFEEIYTAVLLTPSV